MDATEPTYVATSIFQDRNSYEKWQTTITKPNMTLPRTPETVYYEGTLVISSGKFFFTFDILIFELYQAQTLCYSMFEQRMGLKYFLVLSLVNNFYIVVRIRTHFFYIYSFSTFSLLIVLRLKLL
jgi:hypothetical protein